MRGAESVIDIHVAELREAGAKGFYFFGIGFEFAAVFQFHFAFFFDVEAQIFEQDDIAGNGFRARGFDFRADAVIEKLHGLAEQFRERIGDGLKRKLLDAFAIGTSQMAHEDDRSAFVQSIFNRRQRGFDAFGIGDRAGDFVLRHVEIHADEGAFAFQFDIFNKQFSHKIKSAFGLPRKQG